MRFNFLTSIFLLSIILFSCENSNYKPGEVYSIESGDGTFGVVKVLVVEPGIIHLKIYKNSYDNRPEKINLNDLSMGGIGDDNGFGIGHAPFDPSGFNNWKPILLAIEEVSEDELFGYNIWKENN